ncbi:MAG: cytochrome c biogenesis protein [Polyangiales bacterium]
MPTDHASAWLWHAAILALAGLMGLSGWAIFVHAPVELQMGIVQKIFYVHVPAAMAMYLGFVLCTLASAVSLWRRSETNAQATQASERSAYRRAWADALAVAGAEVGLLFCVIVLITGPLWARKAWGVWWTWDPRLTTTLLAGLMYAAYLALRGDALLDSVEQRFAAGLSIVALINLPVIHYSVKLWRGQHPTVISDQGGGLHPAMGTALSLSFVCVFLLAALLIHLRADLERRRGQLRACQRARSLEGMA